MRERTSPEKPKAPPLPKPVNLGGRPRKFKESSRPVTVTLPERTLKRLESIDRDRALAIAKATDWATTAREPDSPSVELIEVEKGRAVIIVGPSKTLPKIVWLKLVEIAPARYLLVLPTGTAIESLEVSIMDLIDNVSKEEVYERNLLTELRRCLTLHRRSDKVSKAELLFIDIS